MTVSKNFKMYIIVKNCLSNDLFTIKVSKDEKISAIKTRIAKIVERDPEIIRLTFGLWHLDDDKNMSDYKEDIKEGSMFRAW